MSKMTRYEKERFVALVMNHRFGAAMDAINATALELANECYDRAYPEAVKKQIAATPPEWLDQFSEHGIRVSFNGKSDFLNFNGQEIDVFKQARETVDYVHRICPPMGGETRLMLKSTDPLTKKWEAMKSACAKLDKELESAATKLWSIVNAHSTPGGLVKAWPEADYFLKLPPKGVPLPAGKSLVAKPSDLNKLFGLPVEDAKAA